MCLMENNCAQMIEKTSNGEIVTISPYGNVFGSLTPKIMDHRALWINYILYVWNSLRDP